MKQSKYIDHTVLKATTQKEDVIKIIHEAIEYDFASVCVNPTWVPLASKMLQDTDVLVCTVIGFPLGANTSATKAFETKDAVSNGAQEIDMVINIGAAKDHDFELVYEDIKSVVDAADGTLVKVIIETCYLTLEEKEECIKAAVRAGAHFVKTSTGFGTNGATVEDIKLMRSIVGPDLGVKASGGVRSPEDFDQMISAGANRIGTSSGVKLVQGELADTDY